MKKLIVAIIIIVTLCTGAILWFGKKNSINKFRTEKVAKGDIIYSVTASGTVNAVTTVLVGTQVSGTIKDIFVDYNSPVKKGQVIALIDPALFEAQKDQAKANLLSSKANLEKSETALADAQRNMGRTKVLFTKGLISRSDLDTAETAYETAKAQVEISKAQLLQAEAALKIASTNLRYTRIISPVNGTVVSKNVDIGQTVAASFQTPTLFTIAQDLTKMQVDCNVAEADIGRIRVGQEVEFTVDAYPDRPFKGKVSEIRNAPITVQNVVTYDVVIRVGNPELKLKPGMTANTSIIVSVKRNVLKIPNAALRYRPPERKGSKPDRKEKGSAVWGIGPEGPKRIPVTTGISDGNFTELITGEIAEGQELIVEAIGKKPTGQRPSGPRMF